MFQKVDHRVNCRLYLKILPFFCDEVEIDKKRIVFRGDFDGINDFVVVATAWFFAHVAYLSGFEDQQIEFILERLDYFLRMRDYHLDLLCEGKESLFDKIMEKGHVLENVFVGFAQYLCFEAVGQFLYKILFFLKVELLLHVD